VEPPTGGAPDFSVGPIGPTPARGPVQVRFTLPSSGALSARIYDAGGRLARTLANGEQQRGVRTLEWDRRNDIGQRVAAGVYFLRSTWTGEDGRATVVSRMVLLE
jgi:flagellar hook assembly protein FlgD